MTIDHRRRDWIVDLADFIGQEYADGGPVDVEEIARSNRITFSKNNYGSAFDGMLEHKSGRFHIYCNVSEPSRARFTFGHELGHFYIDEHRNALSSGEIPAHHCKVNVFKAENLVEQEADLFSANLLMPPSLMEKKGVRASVSGDKIRAVAKSFEVSLTSAALRSVELTRSVCVMIKWGDDNYKWKRLSDAAFQSGYRKTISTLSEVPRGSLTEEILRSNRKFNEENLPRRATTCSYWFPFIRMGAPDDNIWVEEVIPTGRFGVITLLYPDPSSKDY